jgi:hypothetical protein
LTVQRPSPESSTKPEYSSVGFFCQRHGGEIEQPGRDHAAAPPDLGDVGMSRSKRCVLGQRVDIGVLQDVEALGIGLHQAVFDAVMDHLDEMAGADRAGVDVALLDPRDRGPRGPWCADVADAGRQRLEDRIEPVDHRLVAADHHAIAALDAPDAAGGADVDIVDAALLQRLAAADVVLPEGVAAVDDDVAGLHQLRQRLDGRFGDLAGRQHHPGGARLLQLLDECVRASSAGGRYCRPSGRDRSCQAAS